MAELPSGSNLINAQFWEAPDGTWWQYLNSSKRFVQRATLADLYAVSAGISRPSDTIVPTIGQSVVIIDETAGNFIHFVVANGVVYKIGDGVTFDSETGAFDFSGVGIIFYGGDKVWAEYSDKEDDTPSTSSIYIQVDSYSEMRDVAVGSIYRKILVLNDEKRGVINSPYDYWPSGIRLWNGYINDDNTFTNDGQDTPINISYIEELNIQNVTTYTFDDFESDGISVLDENIGITSSLDLKGVGPLIKTTDDTDGQYEDLLPGIKITIDGFIADENTTLIITYKQQ